MKKAEENNNKRIFLDYASSTPVAPEVVEAMRPWVEGDNGAGGNFANPSALYIEALAAKEAVSMARRQIAEILSAQASDGHEIVFTSGGTESNNLALLGVFDAYYRAENSENKKNQNHNSENSKNRVENSATKAMDNSVQFVPHFVVCALEHPAILEVCEEITYRGGEVTVLPVDADGLVSPASVREALRENTVLVSVMYANNEIGTIQPIHDIGRVIKEWRARKSNTTNSLYPYFHTDACQAALYLPLNVLKLGVDMMTLDGIKMYGPRGMGMLYVRDGVELCPVVHGGGQERGLRSGTENVPGIVGMAAAMELAEEKKESESARLTVLRDQVIEKILARFPDATLNGARGSIDSSGVPMKRLPNNINICFGKRLLDGTWQGIDAEFAVISLDVAGIACSYSSSCRTLSENSSSYVVSALGKPDCADSSLRFTLGRETTAEDIGRLVKVLGEVIKI